MTLWKKILTVKENVQAKLLGEQSKSPNSRHRGFSGLVMAE